MTRITSSRVRSVLAICALLSMLILAACGSASPSTQATDKHITLTFGWWSNGPQHDQQFANWVQSYTKTHPNISIKSEFLPFGDYLRNCKPQRRLVKPMIS